MLKATHGKHRAKRSCLFFFLLCISCLGRAAVDLLATSSGNISCPASEAYLAELESTHSTNARVQDLSCLTDLPTLSDTVASYQLVDIQRDQNVALSVPGAWQIPVAELRTKTFLTNKRLLLLGDGFSRAQAAHDCATLKQAGFQQVQILVGGTDTWRSATRKRDGKDRTKVVSARQLVFEYFNSQVTIVTTSESKSAEVKSLGLSNHYLAQEIAADGIRQLAVNHTSNGFYPLVIIADSDTRIDERLLQLPNVYQLTGGVEAIRDYLEDSLWTNLNRSGVPRRYLCGRT